MVIKGICVSSRLFWMLIGVTLSAGVRRRAPRQTIGRVHPQPHSCFGIKVPQPGGRLLATSIYSCRTKTLNALSETIDLDSIAKMASSDSIYVDEDVYSRESTDRDGIVQATGRERIFMWHSFLDLVLRAGVPIIPPSEFEDGGVCRILGRGATMVVSERVLKASQSRSGAPSRAGGGDRKQPAVVAVKQLIVRFADSEDYLRARPQHEIALLANFTLELRALCHGALRSHTNIV